MKPLPYRKVIKKARKAGFILRRKTTGTHEIWWNEKTRRTCVIPHHKEIKPGTLKSIVDQMGVTRGELERL
jgi:predicted RNA binding protein YcfA (HicA-like mRNA interferase family)